MFIWKCSAILNEFKKNLPAHYDGLMKIKEALDTENEFSVIEEVFNGFEKISIDYGIMEKSSNVAVVEGVFDWDDVGSWLSVERHFPKDEQGNVVKGKFAGLDSNNNIIIGEDRLISTIGLNDFVIVDTKDAILIMPKDKAQDVKKLVKKLEESSDYKNLT
jgi:mannose-1-phosphate guanylyltransferase